MTGVTGVTGVLEATRAKHTHPRGAAGGERKRATSDPHGDRARRHAPDAQWRRILPRAALRIEGLHACEGTVAPQPTWL